MSLRPGRIVKFRTRISHHAKIDRSGKTVTGSAAVAFFVSDIKNISTLPITVGIPRMETEVGAFFKVASPAIADDDQTATCSAKIVATLIGQTIVIVIVVVIEIADIEFAVAIGIAQVAVGKEFAGIDIVQNRVAINIVLGIIATARRRKYS